MSQISYDDTPTLYLVPTPIGNLGDMTYRSIEVLKNSEVIFSEDTRETKKLLDYYRLRIEGIIKERIDWLKELEGINIANENFHDKEWELYNLNDKIAQLQQTLTEANIALNNERRRVISFNTEIDSFKSTLYY